jgi:hypothetical protein
MALNLGASRIESSKEDKLKTHLSIALAAFTLTLAACSPAAVETKSTLKACELQKELSEFSLSQVGNGDPQFYYEVHERSLVVAETAEDIDSLPFEYQSAFFAALADPNLPGDWEPSNEMIEANSQIALICQAYGILF